MSAKGHASFLMREVDEREKKTGVDGQKLEGSEAHVSSVASSNWKMVQPKKKQRDGRNPLTLRFWVFLFHRCLMKGVKLVL